MKTHIIGFPKSGTCWLSYMVEYLTGGNVNGYRKEWRKDATGDPFQKRHDFIDVEKFDRLIMPVRDPFEAIGSFMHRKKSRAEEYAPQYIELLEQYDEHEGAKLMLSYELLTKDPSNAILMLSKFLGESEHKAVAFTEKIEFHQNSSRGLYGPDLKGKSYPRPASLYEAIKGHEMTKKYLTHYGI